MDKLNDKKQQYADYTIGDKYRNGIIVGIQFSIPDTNDQQNFLLYIRTKNKFGNNKIRKIECKGWVINFNPVTIKVYV